MIKVFERIKTVANADMVGKVKACYVFQVDGEDSKYYIDFKEGDGQVGEGEVPNKPADFKPEVKITMSKENMLKMFNRKYLSCNLKPLALKTCNKILKIAAHHYFTRRTSSCYSFHDREIKTFWRFV